MKTSDRYLIVKNYLISAISGCKKDSSKVPVPMISNNTKPATSIIKPTPGKSFVPDSAIAFQATFSDNEKLIQNFE